MMMKKASVLVSQSAKMEALVKRCAALEDKESENQQLISNYRVRA
jgi:hypothetical protein